MLNVYYLAEDLITAPVSKLPPQGFLSTAQVPGLCFLNDAVCLDEPGRIDVARIE